MEREFLNQMRELLDAADRVEELERQNFAYKNQMAVLQRKKKNEVSKEYLNIFNKDAFDKFFLMVMGKAKSPEMRKMIQSLRDEAYDITRKEYAERATKPISYTRAD